MPEQFPGLDLGAGDYQPGGDDDILGLSKFTSKPSPKPYQPFGGPIKQQPQSYAQPQSYEPAQNFSAPSYNVFSDDELDTYERAKKDYSYVNNYATSAGQIASKRKSSYDDFMKNKLAPFFESVGGFGDFDDDDGYISALDEMEKQYTKASQMDDGFFGPSKEKIAAGESLNNFKLWSSPNGLRDQYRRLRAERDQYQGIADAYKNEKIARLEQLTSIPIPAKQALDEALKSRGKSSGNKPSAKKANQLLNSMQFEEQAYTGAGLSNQDRTDPRSAILFDDIHGTAKKRQAERMSAAMRGDIKGVLSRRQHIARERQLRDKGFFFSQSGLLDGRPIGMSRRDVDLLDIDDMRKAGMTSFQGKPLDQAMADLGGEERLEMAKVMQSVYSAKSNYEDAQLKFLRESGGPKADKLRDAMEAAREDMQKTVGLAASYGLDNELFEQAETTGWLSAMGNAVQRGALMSEMSDYTPDFLTNTLDADEMQRFIEIASEIEKLPTSSTMKRVKETKSDGFLDAMGNLLFDNPAAIPEMFVESLSSFLPSTIKWLLPSAAAGAAAGTIIAPGAGTATGAAIGARASWGVASFVLEASGMALEGMQELGIDWKNPKVFAAAWTNESIRSKIQKKMVQKGTPIAIADMLTGMMAGKVMGVVNHTGNAVFKGGKLLNKEAFNAANGAVPRFTLMQKTRNAAAELGADSFMGMSGEYLGQWASKEPGEDWDWDAIAAEGLVGVGPGAVGAALEMRGPRANYFGNAPIEVGSEEQTETGTRGVVTRAGYSAPFQTFSSPEAMGDYLSSLPNANPEAVEFTKGWISELYGMNGKEMSNLKIATSPRTPDANPRNRGTFESRDGQKIIYLNEEEFASDPMATFMHEAGHMARVITMDDKKLMDVWKTVGEDAQKDAYAQYFTKRPGIKLSDLDPATQKKVESSFKKTDDDILAEEWFSYQFAQFIMGKNSQVEPDVQGALQTYKEKLGDTYAQYAGTDAKGKELFGQIYAMLNLGPLPEDTQTAEPTPSGPKTDKDLQSNLNAMPGKPAGKVKIAKALNAMAGEKILSTDPKTYSAFSIATARAAAQEIEGEYDEKGNFKSNPNLVKSVEGGVQPFTDKKIPVKEEKEVKKEYPKDKPLREGEERTRVIPSEQKIDRSDLVKPKDREIASLEKQIERTKELSKKADTPKKKEAFSKRTASLESDLKSLKNRDKLRVYPPAKTANKPKPQATQLSDSEKGKRLEAQIAKTQEKLDRAKSEAEKNTLRRQIKILTSKIDTELNKAASPAFVGRESESKPVKRNMSKRVELGKAPAQKLTKAQERASDAKALIDRLGAEMALVTKSVITDPKKEKEAFEALKAVKKKFKNLKSLDDSIRAHLVETKEAGDTLAAGKTISSVLDLETLIRLSPSSFIGELEKAMDPTLGKIPNAQDIEDMALEAREQVESKKEVIESRIAEVDREIRSLEEGRIKPQAASQKPEAGDTTIEAEISELKEIRKRLVNNLELISPENLRLDWKDVSHPLLWYRIAEGKPGTDSRELLSEPQRLTFGMMADPSSYAERSLSVYNTKQDADKDKPRNEKSSLTPQEELWDFVTGGFDESIAPRGQLAPYGIAEDGVVRTLDNFNLMLTAVKASAMFPKQRDVGSKSMGRARYAKVNNGPVGYARKSSNGFEVSSKAPTDIGRAFSAFNAKLSDGKSIEYHYQVNVKGYPSIKAGKGKPPLLPAADVKKGGGFFEDIYEQVKANPRASEIKKRHDQIELQIKASSDGREKAALRQGLDNLYEEMYELLPVAKSERRINKNLDSYGEYKKLWERFAKENPKKIEQLRKASTGKKLTDQYANTSVNQARALYDILSKESSDNYESRKGYPSGYTTDKGANLAAVIAERIREKKLTGTKKKGSEEKAYLSIDLVSDEPTIEEVLGLAMANGRTLELLGDPSDSMKDFDQAMFIIARENLKAGMMGAKKKGGVPTDIDQETDYAEQAGDPWPKVQGSATFSKTLSGIVSTKARIKFENDYINYVIENVQSAINGFKTGENAVPGQSLTITGKTPQAALKEFDNFLAQAEESPLYSKDLINFLRNRKLVLTERLSETQKAKEALEETIKNLDSDKKAAAFVALLEEVADGGDVVLANKRIIKGFDIKPESDYNYRRPLERTSETIPAKAGRDSFTASKIYETFDVMTAFAAGRTLDGKEFEKEQTNIGKSETMPDRPIEVSRDDADLLSSVDINAVDFANWYLKSGKPEDQMRALQFLPSSQTSKDGSTIQQLPGGLGEGLLPYVFMDFARSMYKKLGIKGFDTNVESARKESGKNQKRFRKYSEVKKNLPALKELEKQKKELEKAYDSAKTADEKAVLKDGIDNLDKELQSMRLDQAPQDSNFQWNFERGQLFFNGKLASFDAFLDKEKRLDPAAMAALGKPIVQAVLDAEAIDVYRQTDPNAENMLQRDTQKGGAREDNSADMRDDSGSEDTQVAKAPKGQLESGMSQFDSTYIKKTDFKLRDDLQKMAMAEFKENPEVLERLSYEQLSELLKEDMGPVTEVLQKELEKRALRKDMSVTFSPGGTSKVLNSDAKILTSDADPNLSKATLLGRIAGDRELVKEFKEWAGDKKESLSKGSFKMNFVDRADPLKQIHRGVFNALKKVGLDEKSPLYSFLNVRGRYHQYFGKGYETVEQAQLKFITPLKDLMRKYGVTQGKFGTYLLARAAPSRNMQLEARAREHLDDIAKEEKEGKASDKYVQARKKYYADVEETEFLLYSGIDTEDAVTIVKNMESESTDFKKFLEEALPIYYSMNSTALQGLVSKGMIAEAVPGMSGTKEQTAMMTAMSRYKWSELHPELVQPKDTGDYSYAPMQGFEGETEQYFDNEAAWEEFGAGANASGKGFDQPKSQPMLKGAFGRDKKSKRDLKGPNPELVFANSINQFFDNAIRGQKNEVAQNFGTLYEQLLRVVYPEVAEKLEGKQPSAPDGLSDTPMNILDHLDTLDKEQKEAVVAELKKEFDKVFEPEMKEVELKKMYEIPDGSDKMITVVRTLSAKFKNDPTVFVYRRDGIPKFIKLKETPEGLRMADSMKNLRYESLPSILGAFNIGTRWMARMFTSMNPAFILPNFFRDWGTAAIHLTEDHKKVIAKDALSFGNIKSYVSAIFKAEKQIGSDINPVDDPEVKRLMELPLEQLAKAKGPKANIARYQFAKRAGAKIGYFRHESVPELIKNINKDLRNKKGPTKSTIKKIGVYVDSANTAIENGIRMSSFWAAAKNGFTADEAANIARNVTVDFNQKGNLTQAFGSLYVFFGASVNSMHRFVTSWKRRSPEDRLKMFGGIMAASMVVALFNRLVDDDEDEEMPDYDTISTYKRDTNFILPAPAGLPKFFNDEKDTGYFSMPLPLGYNLFWTIGQVAADMVASGLSDRGGTGLIGGTTRILESAMNAFNPIGGATIATIGTPTAITPFMELYANKNFMGRPIRNPDRPFEVPKPAHMQDPRSTPEHWTKLSRAINNFMGGSDDVKGSLAGMVGSNPLYHDTDSDLKFDIAGNQMKHLFYGYLGGPGQLADTFLGGLLTAASGDPSIKTIGDIPILNRFMRASTYGATTRETFYSMRDAIKNAEVAVKSAKIIGPKVYTTALNDNKKLLQLSSQISAFDKQKNKMRRLKKQVEASKALSEEQKTQRVDEIQKKELNLMIAVIKKAQALGIS